jgi:hypothetical protein
MLLRSRFEVSPWSRTAAFRNAIRRALLRLARATLAIFIRFWLTTTPALPEPAAQSARAKAGERYDAFVAALGRRLANGPKLRQEISEDVPPHEAE